MIDPRWWTAKSVARVNQGKRGIERQIDIQTDKHRKRETDQQRQTDKQR